MSSNQDPEIEYALGHDASELRRLELQGAIFAPGTEYIMRMASLEPGMSVLDIGTGTGDVAMLAHDLVGPSGHVTSIDREAAAIERARRRADASGHEAIRFETMSLDELPPGSRFDFVVGRYVLVWQQDRSAFLKEAARLARPGGTVLFIEPDFPEIASLDDVRSQTWSRPQVALYEEAVRLILLAFGLVGARIGTGGHLVDLFFEAGLGEPALQAVYPIGGPSSPFCEWICLTLKSLLPVLERNNVEVAAAADLAALERRMRDEATRLRSVLYAANLVGGWTRVS